MAKRVEAIPHGGTYTRLYKTWADMRLRCRYEKSYAYHRYGGRGIAVCEEWLVSFSAFRSWALANGYRDDLEIDRIDNDGDYSPENCRWVTHKENCQNREVTIFLVINGESKTLSQWADDSRCEVGWPTLRERYYRGWLHDITILQQHQRPVYVNNQKRTQDRACMRYAQFMRMI